MKTISLKIDDSIFETTESILSNLKKPRNRYINEALKYYNAHQKRKLISEKLRQESKLVKAESSLVLKEFENIDYEN